MAQCLLESDTYKKVAHLEGRCLLEEIQYQEKQNLALFRDLVFLVLVKNMLKPLKLLKLLKDLNLKKARVSYI